MMPVVEAAKTPLRGRWRNHRIPKDFRQKRLGRPVGRPFYFNTASDCHTNCTVAVRSLTRSCLAGLGYAYRRCPCKGSHSPACSNCCRGCYPALFCSAAAHTSHFWSCNHRRAYLLEQLRLKSLAPQQWRNTSLARSFKSLSHYEFPVWLTLTIVSSQLYRSNSRKYFLSSPLTDFDA